MRHVRTILGGSVLAAALMLVGGSTQAADIRAVNYLTGPDSTNINTVSVVDVDSRFDLDRLHHRSRIDHRWRWDDKRWGRDRDRFDDRWRWDDRRRFRDRDRFDFRSDVDIRQDVNVRANTGYNVQRGNTFAGDILTGDIDVEVGLRN